MLFCTCYYVPFIFVLLWIWDFALEPYNSITRLHDTVVANISPPADSLMFLDARSKHLRCKLWSSLEGESSFSSLVSELCQIYIGLWSWCMMDLSPCPIPSSCSLPYGVWRFPPPPRVRGKASSEFTWERKDLWQHTLYQSLAAHTKWQTTLKRIVMWFRRQIGSSSCCRNHLNQT